MPLDGRLWMEKQGRRPLSKGRLPCGACALQQIDFMFSALLPHRGRPDTGLYLADVGSVQKEHAEPGLADAAADGAGEFSV